MCKRKYDQSISACLSMSGTNSIVQLPLNSTSNWVFPAAPCLFWAPTVDLSPPKVLHTCCSSWDLSGFIHQPPAAGTAVPITSDRETRWGNGQRQNTYRLNSQLTARCHSKQEDTDGLSSSNYLSSEDKTQQECKSHQRLMGDWR